MADPTRTFTARPDGPPTATLPGGTTTDDPIVADGLPVAPPGYVLDEEIGGGGMGVVFRATDVELSRNVAVKILRPRYAPGSAAAQRFVDEARITAQLQHPGIPPVYRVGSLPDGRPFLAMKLIKGHTLDNLLKNGAVNTLAVFENICQAVGYAHAHGVIHRDLKPANVMVGSFGEVQVMDWGLAKVLPPSPPGGGGAGGEGEQDPDATAGHTAIKSARDAETQTGSALGTPAYMPPEQAVGAIGKIDARSDVFGLGAILAVVLTGRPPFVGDSAETTRVKAATGDVADCFARLDGCGAEPDLIALCKRCLSPKAADRPADAGAVAAAVHDLRAAAAERARRAEVDRERAEVETREQRKRRRVVQWAGGVTAAVLAAGVVGTTSGLVQARDARERERQRADGERVAKDEEARQRGIAEAKQAEAVRAAAAATAAQDAEARQRAKAERAYARTADALDAMVSDAAGDSLAAQKAVTPEQRRFLAEVLTYYREFAAAAGDDQAARARAARAAFHVGVIEYRLDRADAALAALRTARDGYAALAADFPAVPFYRQEQAGMWNEAGLLLARLGKWEDAEEHHRRALAVREKLAADLPGVVIHHRDVARSLTNLANALSNQGKTADAAEMYRRSLTAGEKLAADHPDDPVIRSDLAGTHNNLGLVLVKLKEPAKAAEQFRRALAIREKLVADFPGEPDYRRDVARSHTALGTLAYADGRWADAEPEYRKGLAAHERLAADFPSVPLHRVELGGGCCNFAHLLRDRGDPAASLDWYRKAIDTLRPVHEADPRYFAAKQFLRNSYWGRAVAHDRLRRYADAVPDWDRAVELTAKPEQPFYRACRAAARCNNGQVAEAAAEVIELTKASNWNAENWYAFACVFAVASGKLADKKAEYGERAVQALRQAEAAGFRDAALAGSDHHLAAIRDRDDFRRWLADLAKKHPPKREVLPAPRRE